MRIEDPKFCVCYTVIVPPFLFTLGSGFVVLAFRDDIIITEIIYCGVLATMFIIFGLYMCIYTLKEFVHFNSKQPIPLGDLN